MAMVVLNGLASRFESLAVALDAFGNEDSTSRFDLVKSCLLRGKQRTNIKYGVAETSAFLNCVPNNRYNSELQCSNWERAGCNASKCRGKDINGLRPPPSNGLKPRFAQRLQPSVVTR